MIISIVRYTNREDFWYSPILNWIDSFLDTLGFNPIQNNTSSAFNVIQYGSFTANFDKRPPPLPPEYWGILFGVIVTYLVGTWFIPTIIGWFKAKRQHRSLRKYRKRIDSLNDGKLDSNDIKQKLIKLKSDITHVFEKGKISNQQYGNLKNEISVLYQVYNKLLG